MVARNSPPLSPVNSGVCRTGSSTAMAPAGTGRAERLSGKKALYARGRYFGWSCISRRQAQRQTAPIRSGSLLIVHLPERDWLEAAQEARGAGEIEPVIARFD